MPESVKQWESDEAGGAPITLNVVPFRRVEDAPLTPAECAQLRLLLRRADAVFSNCAMARRLIDDE